jgi:3-mercaptopyruvate sulfurtransferase SseA
MAIVKTSTPTPDPAHPTAAKPTATWVPLITPSATPGEKVPTKGDVPRIGVAEARAKVDAGEAVFVDVRAEATYQQEHITGAISMPAGDVSRRYAELPADKLIIFYCA